EIRAVTWNECGKAADFRGWNADRLRMAGLVFCLDPRPVRLDRLSIVMRVGMDGDVIEVFLFQSRRVPEPGRPFDVAGQTGPVGLPDFVMGEFVPILESFNGQEAQRAEQGDGLEKPEFPEITHLQRGPRHDDGYGRA